MSLQVEQWRKRPVIVDAVLVTTSNARDVAEWCGGQVLDDERQTVIRLPFGPSPLCHLIVIGRGTDWWIAQDPDGTFSVMTDDEWRATHEPRNPEVPRGWRGRFGAEHSTSSPATTVPLTDGPLRPGEFIR